MRETYIPVWTGSMEARGECRSLSTYCGGSQLLGAMRCGDDSKPPAEAGRVRGRDKGPRQYLGRSNPLDPAIRARLYAGQTYRIIARELGCSDFPVRRVARELQLRGWGGPRRDPSAGVVSQPATDATAERES